MESSKPVKVWATADDLLPHLPSKSAAPRVPRSLKINEEQRVAIMARLNGSGFENSKYRINNTDEQQQAQALLISMKLDSGSLELLESRWSVQNTELWGKTEQTKRRKVLYQCKCGHTAAASDKKQVFACSQSFGGVKKSDRRVPYPFTGCLAHVEVTWTSDAKVVALSGVLEHNAACQEAVMNRLPAIPLHDHVYEVALSQLENGANLTAIQETNEQMINSKAYCGMNNPEYQTHGNHRYNLRTSDHATLYRKYNRRLGIDTRKEPQYNIDDWLNPDHKDFNPVIHNAVFHYAARAEKNERLKVCIATEEMDEAAKKYIHHSQLILDGTFGVCSRRVLLFIAMGVDEDGRGVPVALFLFSAPAGSRATHAGYNTAILQELLGAWRDRLSKKFGFSFEPYSAITDTDTKERSALLNLWSLILKCKGPEGLKEIIKQRLFQLETNLIATVDHSVAIALIQAEQGYLSQLGAVEANHSISQAALQHVDYLLTYWMPENMWRSWAEWGRCKAAERIGIPVQSVIPTTNHLESFNCIIKRKFIRSWLRSGNRLRVDFLILILITRILPDIFSRRRTRATEKEWIAERFKQQSGGKDLLQTQKETTPTRGKEVRKLAWWSTDESRHNAAVELASKGHLMSIGHPDADTYTAACASSTTVDVLYSMSIYRSGEGTCGCPDFQTRGGACKHLRALRFVVDSLVLIGQERSFLFPATPLEAAQVERRSLASTSPHDSFTKLSPPIDLSAIQAFGDDHTVLGNELDKGILDEYSDDEPEDEREAEAEESNLGTNFIGFEHVLRFREGQEASITKQIHDKLNVELRLLLPRIHGVDNILSDTSTLPKDTEQLDELYSVTQSITKRISALREKSASLPPDTTPVATPAPVYPHTAIDRDSCKTPPPKRARLALLPPSPEKKQLRKLSNGTL